MRFSLLLQRCIEDTQPPNGLLEQHDGHGKRVRLCTLLRGELAQRAIDHLEGGGGVKPQDQHCTQARIEPHDTLTRW